MEHNKEEGEISINPQENSHNPMMERNPSQRCKVEATPKVIFEGGGSKGFEKKKSL